MDKFEMKKALEEKFPGVKVVSFSSEWYGDDSKGLVVSGEEGEVNDRAPFDYYNNKQEVESELESFLEDAGWFAECQDPGTYVLVDNRS